MDSKRELLEIFKKLKDIELAGEKKYDQMLKMFKNEEITKNITFIRDQEINHAEMVESLIKHLNELRKKD